MKEEDFQLNTEKMVREIEDKSNEKYINKLRMKQENCQESKYSTYGKIMEDHGRSWKISD